MANSITVNTVQGIGDLFWVYQKLAPHFDVINFNVLCVDVGPVQLRGKQFLRMLPKVGAITYEKVPSSRYHAVAQTRYSLPLDPRRAVDYAVNAPLEVGVNLLEIDPGAAVDSFVDLGLPATEERGDYLCVFVAGAKAPTLWAAPEWVAAIRKVAEKMNARNVALIGADWDKPVQNEVHAALRRDYVVTSHVGMMNLGHTVGVIRRSRFFLGFQSGLNVLAENYDVPQLMVYFAKLRPMMFTWCKPESVRTRFHAMTFGDGVDAAIAKLPLCPKL